MMNQQSVVACTAKWDTADMRVMPCFCRQYEAEDTQEAKTGDTFMLRGLKSLIRSTWNRSKTVLCLYSSKVKN